MQHQTPRRFHPFVLLIERAKTELGGVLPFGSDEPQPVGHPVDVAVDGDRRDPKSVPQDDRGRLPPDPAEPDKVLHRPGDLAAELREELLGGGPDRLRLHPEEPRLVDVGLELGHRDGHVIGRPPVFYAVMPYSPLMRPNVSDGVPSSGLSKGSFAAAAMVARTSSAPLTSIGRIARRSLNRAPSKVT